MIGNTCACGGQDSPSQTRARRSDKGAGSTADFTVKPLEANLDLDHLTYWDVVVIGAGPAGLAAGLTTVHRALTTLIIEEPRTGLVGSRSFSTPTSGLWTSGVS
jgi:NADPH-dependent 2,4-dienoyl-CoA reductase/sulfur reductase-like enzyme